MASDSASAMFAHISDTMPIPKRRRANNLNSHFDRMVQTMNMRCHSPPQRRRIRSTGSSSVTSSEYMPKTPLDDYDGLGEGHLGPDFSLLRKRRRNGSPEMASSSTSKAAPDPLPEWLAHTVGALPASNPLRMLVPTTPDATEIEHSEDEDDGPFRFTVQASDPVPPTMESASQDPQVTGFVPFTTPGPPPPPPPRLHTPRYLTSSPVRTSSARPTSLPLVSHHKAHIPMLVHHPSSPQSRKEGSYTLIPRTSAQSSHLSSSSSPIRLNEVRLQLSSPSQFGSLFTTPGPGYVSSRPMYYDSPTEPPEAASSPMPIDSWSPNDIDTSELDFQWTPYDRSKDNIFDAQRPEPKMLFNADSERDIDARIPRKQNQRTPNQLWLDALHKGLQHESLPRDNEFQDFLDPTLAPALGHASPTASMNARPPAFPAMYQHHSAIISHKLLQQPQIAQNSPGSQSLAASSPSRVLPSLLGPTASMTATPSPSISTNVLSAPPHFLPEHSDLPLPPRPPSVSLSDDDTRFRFAPPRTPPPPHLEDKSRKMDLLRSPEKASPVSGVGSPRANGSHPGDEHSMVMEQPQAENTPPPSAPTNVWPTVDDQILVPTQQGHNFSVDVRDTSPIVRPQPQHQSKNESPTKPKSERASPPRTPCTVPQSEYGRVATPAVVRPPLPYSRPSKFKPAGVSKRAAVHPDISRPSLRPSTVYECSPDT
ncbi:hypothetical protein CYLTODRAFT_447722, partial [Cylindrobasidium torrendii FP15055 ss-10]